MYATQTAVMMPASTGLALCALDGRCAATRLRPQPRACLPLPARRDSASRVVRCPASSLW